MKGIRKWYGLLLVFCLCSLQMVAQNAADILNKAATVYEESNGIAISFVLHIRKIGQGAESFEGQIQMKGDKFTLVTPDMHVWFDGTTQWVYLERAEEVYVSNPSGEELQNTNPILLLRSYQKGFTVAFKGESTAANGKSAYDVELTPKKKSDIIKIDLQVEKISHFPSRISLQQKNEVSTTIQISQLQTGKNQPDSFFVFKESDYPDAEVID